MCSEPVASASGASAVPTSTGLSYDRLRGYRDDLTRALYEKIQAGVESPQAFAAYARSLRIAPRPGALRHAPDVVQAFVRDLFLTGNGTLFVNNTFVEWAAVQAIRRAEPRLLVARYGVRDKMKPFSSLLLFSQPRASDQIPRDRGSRRLVHRRRAAVALRLAERGEEPGLPPAHAAPAARRRDRRHAGDSIGRGRDPAAGKTPAAPRWPDSRSASPTSAPRWRSGSACPRRTRAAGRSRRSSTERQGDGAAGAFASAIFRRRAGRPPAPSPCAPSPDARRRAA